MKESVISIDMRDVRRVTGLKSLSAETAADLLDTIEISSHKKSVNVLSVRLPTFRPDLRESIDLIEEVARLHGYDSIPQNYPLSSAIYDRMDETQFDFEFRARTILAGLGFRETIHYSFTSEENLARYGLLSESCVRIKNPISEEMKVLRTSLLPSLLQTYLYNYNRKVTDQRLFEVAKTYLLDSQEETRVKETPYVSGILSGSLLPQGWRKSPEKVDFYHAKGVVETLFRQLTTVKVAFEPPRNSRLFHPNRSAVLKLGLKEIGFIGEVHPFVLHSVLETDEPIVLFEVNLEALRKYERATIKYRTPSKFPPVELDIALLVEKAVACQTMAEVIRHVGGSLLADVTVFDVYEGDNIPVSKKSLAFHLTFLSHEKTLADEEVFTLKDRMVAALTEKCGAQLRA